MDKDQVRIFLDRIGQLESSGGKYTNHKVLESGMHKGQHAIGTYALMPKTIDELANRSDDPAIKALKGMSDVEKQKIITPGSQLERNLAEELATHVLEKQGGDEQKAAYAWLNGHNLTPEAIEKRNYLNSDYVKRYSKLADLMHNKTPASMPSDDVLNLNAEQRQMAMDALDQEDQRQEQAFTPSATATTPPSLDSIFKTNKPADIIPQEEEAPMTPVKIAPPIIRTPVRFNNINDLVSQYKNLRK